MLRLFNYSLNKLPVYYIDYVYLQISNYLFTKNRIIRNEYFFYLLVQFMYIYNRYFSLELK